MVRHRSDGSPELLVITGRRHRERWVLPNGHLEPGEDPAAAAIRRVREEAGVVAAVVTPLEDVALEIDGERQLVRWYLMEASDQLEDHELREVRWLEAAAALERLTFADARTVAEHALGVLAATADSSL